MLADVVCQDRQVKGVRLSRTQAQRCGCVCVCVSSESQKVSGGSPKIEERQSFSFQTVLDSSRKETLFLTKAHPSHSDGKLRHRGAAAWEAPNRS